MDCKLEDFVVATMLDPRYKSFKFKYAGRWMRGRLTLKQAETWLANAFEADWKPKGPVEEDERPAKKMKSGPTERTSVASFLMCDSDEEDAVEDAAAEECEVEELDEVHRYLRLPDSQADEDVLLWWKKHASDFPNLAKMARQFLGIPASTAGVERAFSAVTFMHSDLRKRLEEGTIQHSCRNTP
ncbi:hypothetical protein CYMTET_19655 [Cymbomonas tetramitiformis]|uniref:HAT C-terminal dimerisation domain-containing protein n=1 Tax=Cymbomonas tetramitiformis TaxID=36881 RepID=A0AAE0G5K9_9CHLO|nr:hypothetical protein CYMTET_19655 [Cymbomonas tetramitiformis]